MCVAAKERICPVPQQQQQLYSNECNNTRKVYFMQTVLLMIKSPNMLNCAELTEVSRVLLQGESVKYFLDNLDKLGEPVSCFCLH